MSLDGAGGADDPGIGAFLIDPRSDGPGPMRRSRVSTLFRQLGIAAVAAVAAVGAVAFWPEPVQIAVPGVDGVTHPMRGRDAIYHCILEKDDNGLRLLLAERPDLDTPAFEADGWTFLHHAAYAGSAGAVELLIAAGANVNARVNEGPTPLQVARVQGRRDIEAILRQHGAR